MSEALPPCGLYRTLAPIGAVPGQRLVYFHNHGEPGAGLYLPTRWLGNEALFESRGTLLGDVRNAVLLAPLAPQGFYRVKESFDCCEKRCERFEAQLLVQLGYDVGGQAILFTPELREGSLVFPTRGTRIDDTRFADLERLLVPRIEDAEQPESLGHTVH